MTLAAVRAAADVPAEGNPVSVLRHSRRYAAGIAEGECLGLMLWLWCPGCQEAHTPRFRCDDHGGPHAGPCWTGDPTVVPLTIIGSYLVFGGPDQMRCHSLISDGRWQFLTDCTHALAGVTVDLEPLPDWLVH